MLGDRSESAVGVPGSGVSVIGALKEPALLETVLVREDELTQTIKSPNPIIARPTNSHGFDCPVRSADVLALVGLPAFSLLGAGVPSAGGIGGGEA